MDSVRAGGGVLTLLGVAAYALGLVTPYPGRAFSLTAVMVGVALAATGSPARGGDG